MNDSNNDASRGNGNGWTPSQPVIGETGEGIALREIVMVLWSGKWVIAGITAVVFALALAYAFLSTPIYEANALVQIEQQQNQPAGSSSDILSMLFPIAAPAKTEIAIMNSRSVLEPTVKKENLNIVIDGGDLPGTGPSGDPSVEITNLTVPDGWMGKELTLSVKNGGHYVLNSPTGDKLLTGQVGKEASARGGAVKILVSRLDVPAGKHFPVQRIYDQQAVTALQTDFTAAEQGQDTGIVSLTLQGPHPARAKAILNALVNQYIQQNVLAMAAQARQSLAFINKQLPQIKNTLNAAQTKLTQYRTTKGVVNLDQQAQSLLQNLTSLEGQLTQIKLTESAMQQRFTSRYPGIQGLQSQKQDIRRQIDAVQSRIGLLPSKEQDYVSLLQKVQVYQQLYTALLAKTQDLQIAEAGTVGSARIIDYAVRPIKPVKPRKAVIGVLGLILGVFLGVLAVFLRRALRRSVQDAAELEREFGLPVYAIVPHSDRQAHLTKRAKRQPAKGIAVLAADDPRDPTVEAVRSLRTSLNFVLQDKPHKVIAVGGCTPGVGKSFLSVNLAHIIGTSGARILLMDTDLRRGHLEQYMGNHAATGLSQVLSGELRLEEAIRTSPHHDNVDFLGTGPFPPNPYELLAGPRLKTVIEALAERYDVIIMDLPPVLAVAEGLLTARLATVNLFVIKAGVNTLQEIRLATDRMHQNGVKLDGFIYNDLTREASAYTYGHYAKSYYYTRYAGQHKK